MTAFDDADRSIAMWLDRAAAAPAPDYLGEALVRAANTRQRGRGVAWPASFSPHLRRTLLLVAAGLLLLAIGLSILVGATRRPAPITLPTLGLLVSSRDAMLWVAQADGSDAHAITSADMQFRRPRWSTDGTRIAAWGASAPSNGSIHPGDIYVMDQDGHGLRSITTALDPMLVDQLAWSPDDRRIAIASEGRLFVADADGSRAIRIDGALLPTNILHDAPMSWSPSGDELAIVMQRAATDEEGVLAVVDVRTGVVTVVPTAGPLGSSSLSTASWSPTGDAIAYVATEHLDGDSWTGKHVMQAVRAGGSWTESALVRADEPPRWPITGKPMLVGFAWPAWSNDGTRIAWYQAPLHEDPALWLESADGSAPRRLADLPVAGIDYLAAPAWLPDDSRIAVPNVPVSQFELLLVDPDGVEPPIKGPTGLADWQGVAP